MPDTSPCPDCRALARFLLGQNTPEEAAAVEAHLEVCTTCLASLETLHADDSMVAALRAHGSVVAVALNDGPRLLAAWLKQLRPDMDSTTSDQLPLEPSVTELGPYQLRRILGSGGMGIVFEAYDPQLDRLVALKTMLPAQAANPAARQRFLREARAAAALKHDHIVTIYQVGEDRGIAYLAMELLEGETLAQRLDREGRLPIPMLLRIARECAEALAAAHARGLIHRDIKPANIWLEEMGDGRAPKAKLLDFGLARTPGDPAPLTLSGAIVGTPAYMAPEQLLGQPVDAGADLFSLGCVIYRLATGEAPFKAAHWVSTLIAIATTNPRPPQDLDPDLPSPLCDLILRLLAKRPVERPESAPNVVDRIRALERGMDLGRGASTSAPRRFARPMWLTATALVAGLLGWAAYHGWPVRPDDGAGKTEGSHKAVPADEALAKTVAGSGEGPTRVHADHCRALEEVLDFRELIGASPAELRDWHAGLGTDFRLAFVTCRRGSGPAMLNAVANRSKMPYPVHVEFELTSEQAIDEAMNRYREEDGFSLMDHCTYPHEKTGWAQARIWIKNGVKFLSWDGGLLDLKLRFAQQKGIGRRARCVQWLAGDPWPYQAICADDDEGRGWEVSYSLSPAELLRAVQRQEHKRWRPDLVVPFWDSEQLRFLMIAVENADGPDWRFRMDMSRAEYEDESKQQKQHGLFPLSIVSYGHDDAVRYAAVFVRYR
jgi:hypothetical protein